MDPSIPRQARDHRHLQQIIAGLTEGVILIEPDQTLCWANEAALAMHGAKTLDELGRTVEAYKAKFKLTYRNKHSLSEGDYPIQRAVSGDTLDEVVVEVTRSDRPDARWVHQIRSLVLTTVSQIPELFVLVTQDVTERIDAEERFERTFNVNPAPAVICRLADLRYVKVNNGFLEMTGFPRQEVIGRSVYEIDVLAGAAKREQAVTCLREGRTIEQQEACIAIAGGSRKFVIVAGQPIELADEGSMLFTFIDLEPRKKVEDALRQSEERFAKAFKLAPVPMAVTSLEEALFQDANEAFAKVTGYSHAELLGRSTAEIELWENSSARLDLHRQFEKAGTVRNYEIKLRTKTGDFLDCLVAAERVTILDKPCVLTVIQDITERKRSETQLFAAIEMVMQDTSWFTQRVIEKVADLRQPHGSNNPKAGLEELTERELEVLVLLCTGAGDAEIASQLGRSRHTVRNHVSAIYDKIGVHRRGAAVAWARDRGLSGHAKPATGDPKRRRSAR
jgi:PAS domain S-box-containing protein